MKKTKIIATLGPACDNLQTMRSQIRAGVDVFRINSSHASLDDIGRLTKMVHSVSKSCGKPVAVILDLQGPKIRIGEFIGGGVELNRGDIVTLRVSSRKSDGSFIPVAYRRFHEDISVDSRILLDDGNIALEATGKKGKEITARVIHGGRLKDRKGINLPDASISADPVTARDIKYLHAGIEADVDFVALSFVKSGSEIRRVKKIIRLGKSHAEVIAKIERHEAVQNMDEIIKETDGVMIARGDLGVELPAAKVPVIQDEFLRRCHYAAKPVIIATQMMESMIKAPRPTRAEVSDVATSVRGFADAVMLSAETATGKHPVETVCQMKLAAVEMEKFVHSHYSIPPWDWKPEDSPPTDRAIAHVACKLSELLGANAIAAITLTGWTVKKVASSHPGANIFAFTPTEGVLRKLSLLRGVTPLRLKLKNDVTGNRPSIFSMLKRKKYIRPGDKLILVSSTNPGVANSTNLVSVEEIP